MGENGLRIISPANASNNNEQNLKRVALLPSWARIRGSLSHSLDHVDNPSFNKEENIVQYMKANGEGKVTEETCPKCSKTFQRLSAGVYASESGLVQCYDEDCDICDECAKDEDEVVGCSFHVEIAGMSNMCIESHKI